MIDLALDARLSVDLSSLAFIVKRGSVHVISVGYVFNSSMVYSGIPRNARWTPEHQRRRRSRARAGVQFAALRLFRIAHSLEYRAANKRCQPRPPANSFLLRLESEL